MKESDQIDHFYKELTALVARFCAEYELTTASAIGCLEMKKHELIAHCLSDDKDAS